MKFTLRPQSRRDVWLHLAIIVMLLALFFISFFYIYLPWTTNHGQTVSVPNLVGMKMDELDNYLEQRNLEYLVDDSTFNPDKEPLSVYQQYPLPGEQVKFGRKIFISVNARRPPMVKMPNLLGRSLVNAQGELESYGLRLGEYKYVPDLQQNAVLKQMFNGIDITENTPVPKGSKIELVVGDGLGNQEFDLPDFKGQTREEAEFALTGMGLQLGTLIYQTAAGQPDGAVIRQKPNAAKKVRVGEAIDLWVAGPDPKQNPAEETEDTL